MYSIDKYNKEALLLTNSLVLKIPEVASAMNRGLYRNFGIKTVDDKKTWKYYLNLAGIKHHTNSKIMITYLETGEVDELTKEKLAVSPLTKKTLLACGDKFNELCATYPSDEVYIRGCLYDIDIDKAINANPGEILGYNKAFVAGNEYSLIRELQTYIYNFLSRWHVKEYTLTDDLYLSTMLGILYANIPNKIINIRNKYALTAEAHTFHLQNFFESNMNLWEEVSILKKDTQFWLYKNLLWMLKHIGKGETFSKLAWKILNENNIGLGSYKLTVPDFDDRLLNNSNLNKSSYFKPNTLVQTEKLNDVYEIDNHTDVSLEQLINREMDEVNIVETLPKAGRTKYMVEQEAYDINKSRELKQNTKVLDLVAVKLFLSRGIDPYQVALDHWAYLDKLGKLNFSVDYRDANVTDSGINKIAGGEIDPAAAQTYFINPRQGILMLIKVLLKSVGKLDVPVSKFKLSSIINTDHEHLKKVVEGLLDDGVDGWDDDTSKGFYSNIISHVPLEPYDVKRPEELQQYVSDILDYHTFNWYLDANTENAVTSGNIKNFNARSLKDIEYVLSDTPKTIDELLADEGIDYVLPDIFNLTLSMRGLFKTFIGFDLSGTDDVIDNINLYTSLVNKLTSYTTQVITTSREDENSYINYNHTMVMKNRPMMLITDARLHPIEHNHPTIKSYGDDFQDTHRTLNIPTPDTMVFDCRKPIRGHMAAVYLNDSQTFCKYWVTPDMLVNVIDIPNRDITGCPYTDIFLTIVKATFKPIEDWPEDGLLRASGLYVNESLDSIHRNVPVAYSYPIPDTMVFELNKAKVVKGHMAYYPLKDNTEIYAEYSAIPEYMVSVKDVPNIEIDIPNMQDEFLFIKKATFSGIERYAPDGRTPIISVHSMATNTEDNVRPLATNVLLSVREMSKLDNTVLSISTEVNDGIHPKYYVGQPVPRTAKALNEIEKVQRHTNEISVDNVVPTITIEDAPLSTYGDDSADVTIVENSGVFRVETKDE